MRFKKVLFVAITIFFFSAASTAQNSKSLFISEMLSKQPNEWVAFSLPDLVDGTGIVDGITKDALSGTTVISGVFFHDAHSSFRLEIRGNSVTGIAIMHDRLLAYKLSAQENSTEVSIVKVPLSEVMCLDHPKPSNTEKNNLQSGNKTIPELQMVPLLESLPGATAVLYLDFDGEIVSGTSWNSTYNGGNPIVAATAGLSNANVTSVWQRVAEDYLPFNINVTTDSNKYNAAPQGRRMKCIITPTDGWYPSSVGGVAYIGSFLWTGKTPCWVFITSNNKYIAEACSHELGHTLSLYHDGQNPSTTYYQGHGTGNVGWAPIMGVGYYEYVSQFCIGEYSGANNQEDDLAKISGSSNGFGYRPDDHANTSTGATPLVIVGNNVAAATNSGVIELRTDVDVFQFTITSTFNMNLTLQPGLPGPNLDILAEVYDANSTLILSNNVSTDLYATLVLNNIAPGSYYLHVSGVGYGTPSTGYTDYASLGHFDIAGTLTIVPAAVTITPQSATTFCGSGSAILQASNGFTSYTWAPAASLSASTGQTVTATPTATTTYTVTAVPPSGPNTQAIITVTINPIPTVTSSPASPSFCAGDSVQVTASGALTYVWSPATGLSNPNIAAPYAYPTVTTTYTITGTSNGCTSTATVTVTANPSITISITNSQPVICAGDSSLLVATSNGTTYLWTPSAGLSCTSCPNPVASPTTTTVYSVLITSVSGCSNSSNTSVMVNPLPNVQFNGLGTVCIDWLPITLNTATPIGGTYSGTGVTAGVFDPLAAGVGTHILTYNYTDANGCSNSDTTSIIVDACTGFTDDPSLVQMTLFPVPATTQLTITFGQAMINLDHSFSIVNMLGEQLIMSSIRLNGSSVIIALPPSLEPGVYLLVVRDNAGLKRAASPFVKQ